MKKKILSVLCAITTILTLGSCGGGGKEEIKYEYGEAQMYEKIWESKVIHNETTMIIQNESNTGYGTLLYEPTRVISVRDYTLKKEYDPSEYYVEGNKIYLTENSTMPFLTEENLEGKNLPETIGTYDDGKSGQIPFTEGIGLIMNQVAVTYEHEDTWGGAIPENQIDKLPLLKHKLEKKESVNLVVNGDSIFTGCNSSSILGIEPFQDDFSTGFVNEVKRLHDTDITLTNTSVGGTLSSWGRQNVVNNINLYNPELVIIGFGMNDGSWNISSTDYVDNIEFMIRSIRANTPNCEIIVGATILANPNSAQNKGQEGYLEPLKEMTSSYQGVALLDMTSLSKYLLSKKRSVDLYANNINHPSDFMVRCFTTSLMTLIGD